MVTAWVRETKISIRLPGHVLGASVEPAQSMATSRSFRKPGPGRQPSTLGRPSIPVVAGPILLAYLRGPLSPGKTTHCFHGRACARRMGSAISVERSERAQTGLVVRHYGIGRSFGSLASRLLLGHRFLARSRAAGSRCEVVLGVEPISAPIVAGCLLEAHRRRAFRC